jgi:hypothetical protein
VAFKHFEGFSTTVLEYVKAFSLSVAVAICYPMPVWQDIPADKAAFCEESLST